MITPTYDHENAQGLQEGKFICGVDEVGRGCLAGTVVAAAVLVPSGGFSEPWKKKLADSKTLSAVTRQTLYSAISQTCLWHVAEASVAEIDTLNILNASLLAMTRAIVALNNSVRTTHGRGLDHALIDGNRLPAALPCAATAIVHGDSLSFAIAAASILAKVTRDQHMMDLARSFPAYGWDKNVGYPTHAHRNALQNHGVTPWHRRSFQPVAEALDANTMPTQSGYSV